MRLNHLPYKHNKNRWVLHLTMRCNYECSYCIQKELITVANKRKVRIYKELSGDQWIASLGALPYRPPIAIIMGGEPSLHKDFSSIIIGLLKINYTLDCTTNLSFDVDKFIVLMQEKHTVIPTMWVTYHPGWSDPVRLLDNVVKLRESNVIGKLTVSCMLYNNHKELISPEINTQVDRFYNLAVAKRVDVFRSTIRSYKSGAPFERKQDTEGDKIVRGVQCTSSWVNIAPDGEIYNCAYHMNESKNSFGNIINLTEANQMPEMGEWFNCSDYGWCEACHAQSGHGGFIV